MRKKSRMLKVASLVACSGLTFSFVGNCAEGIPRGMGQAIGGGLLLAGGAALGASAIGGALEGLGLDDLLGTVLGTGE